jgi:outer membrane receptor protein involved in Fe transport
MKSGKSLGLGGLLCTVVFANGQAFGDEAAPAASESATSEGALQLEEIVVTAEKRTERLQEVPVSVTAVDASALASQNTVQLQDYLNTVPGTSVGDLGFGRTQVVIRGISTGFGNNPTTGFTIDDVPINSSTSSGAGDLFVPNLDPADLERVEVLRGPQGTLYGASSMGGLVKYVTIDPEPDAFKGQVQVDGSTVDHGSQGYGVRGSANIPLIADVLGLRVSGFYRHDPGFIDDPSQGRTDINTGKAYGGRVAALWEITPSVNLKISALLQDRFGDGSATEDVTPTGAPYFGDLIHERTVGTDNFSTRVRLYSATLTAGLPGATLTSISGYGQIGTSYPQDVSGNFSPYTPFFYNGAKFPVVEQAAIQTNKLSQEFRLASESNHHLEWLVGAFYTHETGPTVANIFPVSSTTGAALPLLPVIDSSASSAYLESAGFADLTYYFTDQFDVMVGGRYSHNSQQSVSYETGFIAPGGPGQTVTVPANTSGNSTTFVVTPRCRLSDSLMTYVRVASGYRPGGANAGEPAGVPTTFGSDTTINYELGIKGDAFNRRFTYDADVFDINWRKLQIREIDTTNSSSFYTNAGGATSRGAELTLQALPTTGLTLGANVAYTDAYLTQNAPPGVYAPAGTRLPNSSKWSANISGEQDIPLVGDVSGFGSLQVDYVGDRLSAFQNTATATRFVMPSYVTLDLQVGAKTDRWSVNLFARNLTDRRGFLDANAWNVGSQAGRYYVTVIQPRTVGLSLTTKF